MKQVSKSHQVVKTEKTTMKRHRQHKQNHPKFGTSKLEEDFARDFLDKLGLEYEYQFEAKDIGRFYDFLVSKNVILEINGSYWHGDPRLYEEKDLNKVQKKAQRIDEYKEKWAVTHGFPIYYIWEEDIRKNPNKVMEQLKEIFYIKDDIKPITKTTTKTVPRRKTIKKNNEK